MKYTIDGPDRMIEVVGIHEGFDRTTVALLVHLPGADAKTAAMFGRHASKQWKKQPQYASFQFAEGAPVVKWDGKVLAFDDAESVKAATVGRLTSRAHNESGTMSRMWVVDTSVSLVDKE